MKRKKQDSDLLRYEEVAEEFNFPVNTLYSKVSKEEIPHYRIGGRCVRFSRVELLSWLRSQQVSPNKENQESQKVDYANPVVSSRPNMGKNI